MVDRRRFVDFLRQNGYVAPGTPPAAPLQGPGFGNAGSSPSVPHGSPRPVIPPPRTGVGGGTFTPNQVLDQALNSTAASFMDPAQLDNFRARLTQEVTPSPPAPAPVGSSPSVPHGGPLAPVPQNRTSIDAWLALPPEVRAVTPPTDPQGNPYPNWTKLTPEQQAVITEQLAAGPVDDFLGLDKASETVEPVVNNPVTRAVVDYGVKPIVKVLGIPEEQYRQETMDVAYYMSTHNGQVPTDYSDPGTYIANWLLNPNMNQLPPEMQAFPPPNSGITDGQWLGMSNEQKGQAYIQASKDANNPLSKLQIITYLNAHPEFLPTVKSIYETAEARGEDGTKAVDAWWANQQGVAISTVSSLIFDPLNLAAGAGIAGRGLTAVAKTKEAEEGVTVGSRILRTGGRILEAPDAVVNKPIETASAITRGTTDVLGNIPGVKQLREYLTAPGAQQQAVDAMAKVENTVEQGAEIATRAAEQVRQNQADVARELRRAEGVNTIVTPERNLSPEDLAAEREIQQRAAQANGQPEPETGATTPTEQTAAPSQIPSQNVPVNAVDNQAPLSLEEEIAQAVNRADDDYRAAITDASLQEQSEIARLTPERDPYGHQRIKIEANAKAKRDKARFKRNSDIKRIQQDFDLSEEEIDSIRAGSRNTQTGTPSARPMSPKGVMPSGATRAANEVFDDALGLNDPLPPNVQSAFDANRDILADAGRTEREIPVEQVPTNSRIVATQSDLLPEQIQAYIDDPNLASTADMPIAIKDGDTYYVIEGHHRTAAARESGFDTIPMRVINATPAQVADDVAGITPEITARALQDNFPSALPTSEPVAGVTDKGRIKAGHSVTPDLERVGKPWVDAAGNPQAGERIIDGLAASYPEQTERMMEQMDAWARTEYEPAVNKLRTASIDSSDIPGAAPLPDNYANRKAAMDAGGTADREIQFYEGTNKAVAAALEGDYYGRLRFLAYANGVPLEKVAWRGDARLERAIADRALEKMGYRADQTFKHQTREALVTAYIHADEADAPYILKALEDAHVVKAEPGGLAHDRYLIITDARRRAQLTPEEMDQILREAGLEPKPQQVAQEDLAVLPNDETPSPNGQVPQGGSLASHMTNQLMQLPEEVRASAVKQVADWARVNMADFAVKTPRQRVLTELEYAAEVRRAALKNGVDIAPPPMDYNVDDTIDNMLRAIVLEPDESITAPLRKELYDAGVLRKELDPPWEGVTSPDVYVSEKVAHDTYQQVRDIRRALHGPPHEALRRNGRYEATGKWEVYANPDGKGYIIVDADGHVEGLPIPNKREAVKQAKVKATSPEAEIRRRNFAFETEYQKRLDEEIASAEREFDQANADADAVLADLDRVLNGEPPKPREVRPDSLPTAEEVAAAQRTFEDVAARPMRPMSLADYSGDQLVADALRTGGIDKETAATLSRMVTLKDGRELSVMDIVLENMVKHDDLITAHRAAASDIAEAIRQAKRTASGQIIAADAIKMPELNKALRANRYYLNLVREAYLLSPARIVSAGSLDAMGNAWFQILAGHGGTAGRTLNPMAWLGFAKHTMRGDAVRHPLFEIAEKTGMKVDPSIVNVVTRDLLDSGADTTWSDLFSKKLRLGKVGDKLSGVVAPKWGKAMRHGIDQNARAGVAWNVARHELPDARNDLLIHIRTTQGDAAANALVPKLPRSGVFSPDDVLKHTGDESLARWWRERLTTIEKKQVSEVNRVHFDFKITRADEAARNVMLFHSWQSRAMVFYAKTILGNPYLLNLHVKAYEAAEKEAERQHVGNPMNLFLKYMAGNGGLYGYIDPMSWLIPYTLYRDASIDFNGEKGFDKWSRQFGIFVNPLINAAAVMVGQSERFPALLPTTSLQNLVRSVIDWDRNHGDILGKGPGMTGDPFTYVQNRVLDLINGALHAAAPGIVDDVQMPDTSAGQTKQVESLIIEQAEKDFGVPYIEMTPAQRNEVLQAIISLSGTPNARAEEALATWSNGRIIQAGANTVIPGRTTVRSEAYDERRNLTNSAYDKPADQRTPAEQNALAQNDVANAGSPEAATLAVENQNLDDVGTPVQQILYDGWNTIAFGDLPPGMMEVIGGKKYTSEQIMAMSPEDRKKLADLWVLDNHGTGLLENYRKQRGEYIDTTSELGGYKDYQKRAREYGGGETRTSTGKAQVSDAGFVVPETTSTGGMRDFRQYLETVSPEFADEIGQERKRLQAQGLSGEELEARLDIWANSPAGYNAYRGVKDRIGDEAPKDTFDPSKQLPPPGPGESVDASSGTKSTTKSDDYMPDYQVQLITDWDAYSKAVAQFEAENGPLSNYQSPLGKKMVAQYFADQGIELSSDLKKYLEWKAERDAAGEDSSMKAYIDKLNADYKQKKQDREAARKAIESQ